MATKKTTKINENKAVAAEPAVKVAEAPAAEKTVAASTAKAAEKKPAAAAKKAPTKKPAEKKPVAKKPAAKKEVKGTPGIVEIATMLREKVGKKDVSDVNEKIAVEIKVYGEYEAYMYILIDNGEVSVEPYGYMDNDIHIDMPINDVLDLVKGKYDFAAKALSGDFYALGSLTKMLKVKKALF